jgi:hypothetical protein
MTKVIAMKNKIIYSFILIFSMSMITSAKKVQGTCNNNSSCCKIKMQKEAEAKKAKAESELTLPSLGQFLLHI